MTTEQNKDLLIEFGQRIINAMDYTGKAVDAVVDAGNKAVGFVADQLPDVIQQLILYNTVKYSMTIVLSLATIVAYVWMVRYFCKRADDMEDAFKFDEGVFMVSFICGIISAAMTIVGIINIYKLLLITTAPKVWLLEYAAKLING